MKRMLFCAMVLISLGGCGGGSNLADNDADGWLPPADCNDKDPNIHPGAREIPYNDTDEDCDGIANNDADFDGHDAKQNDKGDDCDDTDPRIHPGAPEIAYDGIDQNCNGMDDDADMDGDSHTAKMFGGDDCCDSGLELWLGCAGATAAGMKPGATEIVGNGIDENCDGSDEIATAVEGDTDGDGYASNSRPEGLDCDDTDPKAFPNAEEVCDGKDNDCDGVTDNRVVDFDGDGYPACRDCNEYHTLINPGATEVPYNDVDEDCDGKAIYDVDGDGYWPVADPQNPDRPLDCNDNDKDINPAATELCDHKDNNCDHATDEGFTDQDGDTFAGGAAGCTDCDDTNQFISPAVAEAAGDSVDNNCNGWTDEVDTDGDGFFIGVGPGPQDCCDTGAEAVPGCSPATAVLIHPGAEEIPNNSIDEDCSGADLVVEDIDGDGHKALWAGGDDCDDSNEKVHPESQEDCADPFDNNCSGLVNEGCGPGTGEEVKVEAGPFTMGYDDALYVDQTPAHVVNLSAYAIDKYEVTVADYHRCIVAGACSPPAKPESAKDTEYFYHQQNGLHPVIWVDFNQAAQYCAWRGKRLPTEAEWEKAARGSGANLQLFPWGDVEYTTGPDGTRVRKPVECEKANHTQLWTGEACVGDTDRVDAYPAGKSYWEVYNLSGNVSEWVADWYQANYYSVSPASDPLGPDSGSHKVFRGGSFMDEDYYLEVVFRRHRAPDQAASFLGFRCARSLP